MKASKGGKHPLVIARCDIHKPQHSYNSDSCILQITNNCPIGLNAYSTGGKKMPGSSVVDLKRTNHCYFPKPIQFTCILNIFLIYTNTYAYPLPRSFV